MSVCNKDDVAIDRLLHPLANPHRMCHLVPDYTKKVEDDYKVLVHVRTKLSEYEQERFHDALFDIMNAAAHDRWLYHEFAYEPGDYSRALLAIQETDE